MSDFKWLAETRALQVHSYGQDPATLQDDEFANFVIWNHAAAVDELCEFLGETRWKPWITIRGRGDDEAAIGELIDVAHFIANLAVAMGCDDETWERRYREKMEINRTRQRAGYDGTNKCSRCGRALDDPAVKCTTTMCGDDDHGWRPSVPDH